MILIIKSIIFFALEQHRPSLCIILSIQFHNQIIYQPWSALMNKKKIFIGGLVIGIVCVYVIPDSECETLGDTLCSLSPYIGYVGFGITGLIILQKFLQLIKKLCKCCFQSLMRSSYRADEQEGPRDSLLRDNNHFNNFEGEPEPQPQLQEEESYEQPIFYNQDFQSVRQSFNQKQCTICLEEFNFDSLIDRKKCGHKFHSACINDWLKNNLNCPICRVKIR